MNITLRPEVERWLEQESARTGLAPEAVAARNIEAFWATAHQFSTLSAEESQLLAQINEGFPPEFWRRYRELIARREDETLSAAEQAELIALSDQVEEKNLERTRCLLELARLRGVSLPDLLQSLGLSAVSVSSSE